MEDVPVLELAPRRHRVAFFLVKNLDGKVIQQALRRRARQMRDAGTPRPIVADAIELPGEAPADAEDVGGEAERREGLRVPGAVLGAEADYRSPNAVAGTRFRAGAQRRAGRRGLAGTL